MINVLIITASQVTSPHFEFNQKKSICTVNYFDYVQSILKNRERIINQVTNTIFTELYTTDILVGKNYQLWATCSKK